MNTDNYTLDKKYFSSSNSSESNFSSTSSQSNYSINNNNRYSEYPFFYNICCFCSPKRKKFNTESETFTI